MINRKQLEIQTQAFPEKVLVFGEAAFVCVAFEELNRKGLFGGSVTVIGEDAALFEKQEGLFTVISRGIQDGEKVESINLITCIGNYINPHNDCDEFMKRARNPELRFVVPQMNYAGKITALLHERFKYFKGDVKKGLIFLTCEPIENNGARFKETVQRYASEQKLGAEFMQWLNAACFFANTLTDSIFTRLSSSEEAERIYKKLGYRDELLRVRELFYYWAIEAPMIVREELPLDKSGLNIIFSEDITPHKLRKTRLLNGTLTCLAPAALLHGFKTVSEAMGNESFRKCVQKVLFSEIIPTLDINKNILDSFANTVTERLSNTLIKHELLAYTQNCTADYKAQVLPSIMEFYKRFGELPQVLTFSFAALIAFYKNGGRFALDDEEKNIAFLRDNKLEVIFKNISSAWGVNMSQLLENTQFKAIVEEQFGLIKKHGVKLLIERLVK
jgi:tagaturonate reductase